MTGGRVDFAPPIYSVSARNSYFAYREAMGLIVEEGRARQSRAGHVLELPAPLYVQLARPTERVFTDARRRANPFFHLIESLWMLAGRRDVATVEEYVRRMRDYADGPIIHGAYGYRWREAAGYDQLERCAEHLAAHPDSRRAVVAMWDAVADASALAVELEQSMKDLPCNTHIYFSRHPDSGDLEAVVCSRSHDLIWGLFGANAVHFSVLLEYMAARIGVEVGRLSFFCARPHVYTARLKERGGVSGWMEESPGRGTPYGAILPTEIWPGGWTRDWDEQVEVWLDEHPRPRRPVSDAWLLEVADPMRAAWRAHRRGDTDGARFIAEQVRADDWRWAALQWLARPTEER